MELWHEGQLTQVRMRVLCAVHKARAGIILLKPALGFPPAALLGSLSRQHFIGPKLSSTFTHLENVGSALAIVTGEVRAGPRSWFRD